MKNPMPKLSQVSGKLQYIKGLASPQSSPGGPGMRSATVWPLTSFGFKKTRSRSSLITEVSHVAGMRPK